VQCAFFFNKDAYDKLPADLKYIVDIAAKETQLWSTAWQENLNIEAIKLFKKKVEFVKMDDAAITSFAKMTKEYLDELKAKYSNVKATLDSQELLKRTSPSGVRSEAVSPPGRLTIILMANACSKKYSAVFSV